MTEPFIDCTTLDGQRRIRGYVLGWLERLDYVGRLERSWPADQLADRVWDRVERDFHAVLQAPVVTNEALTRVIASTMVEDYFAAYPERRGTRYAVAGPLPDCEFRRCVLDFIHDLEEFEPAELPLAPEAAAAAFWCAIAESPERWGYASDRGPLVDDEDRARHIAVDAIRVYFDLRWRADRERLAAGRE